jgi:hypothetical protein
VQARFAEASLVHELWGLGSEFASSSAALCSADGDRELVAAATAHAIEMWSDSDVRAEIDLDSMLLPVLRRLRDQNVRLVGTNLPAGVLAQYRRFRREGAGHVVMLDASRIVDGGSRAAALEFLRNLAEGRLDPSKTSLLYRHDDYGDVSYPVVQGPEDASLLRARLSEDPVAEPATIAATGYPCS